MQLDLNVVTRADDRVPVRRIVASVADKSALDRLIPPLLDLVPDALVYSTGGTYAALEALLGGTRRLVSISDYTGQPEMQGGLVKTLDFKIYLGLLSETHNPAHDADLRRAGAASFDMVVGNLYPFASAVSRPGATLETARGNIDIGGPCMIRAAAKNFLRVAAVVDPADYDPLLREMRESEGTLGLATRFRLAQKAFAHTAQYDAAIAAYLSRTDARRVAETYEQELQ